MSARRSQVSWTTKLKSRLWPQEGWKAYGRDLLLRLRRMPGTPRSIAAGVACGVAISFTPFVGFHLLLAALTAWVIRGNILASTLGTAAGNPWTFPFIWLSVLYTGRRMLGGDYAHSAQVDFIHFLKKRPEPCCILILTCFSGYLAYLMAYDGRLYSLLHCGMAGELLSGEEGFGENRRKRRKKVDAGNWQKH